MASGINVAKKRKKHLLNDVHIKYCIHCAIKDASSCPSSMANAGPHVNFYWMLCPVWWSSTCTVYVHLISLHTSFIHVNTVCVHKDILPWLVLQSFILLWATKSSVATQLDTTFISPDYITKVLPQVLDCQLQPFLLFSLQISWQNKFLLKVHPRTWEWSCGTRNILLSIACSCIADVSLTNLIFLPRSS